MAKHRLTLAAVFLCFTMSAFADSFTTFNINGTFTDGTTLSGTVTIDTTAGHITAANIWYSGDGQWYTSLGSQGPYDVPPTPVAYTAFIGLAGSYSEFGLSFTGTSALDSLVGYTGGNLCSQASPCSIPGESGNGVSDWFNGTRTVLLQSGSMTASAATGASVPEPSSLLLFVGGLGAAAGMCRQRMQDR